VTTDVAVRPATLADAAVLVKLLDQLGYGGADAFIERRLRQLLAHPDALVAVAERAGEVLGVIALHFVPQLGRAGDHCSITYLCVAEHARSLGVGAQLEALAVRDAGPPGCLRLHHEIKLRPTVAHRL
jgi:N-acetylglutamate synthase-like GNAT family acetyltransferase